MLLRHASRVALRHGARAPLRSPASILPSTRLLPAPRPARALSSTASLCSRASVNLTGLIPATDADLTAFRDRTSGGFTEAHGVADGIKPAGFDPIPPENARGGRDVAGWRALYTGTVGPNWCNLHKTMHGGCAAWLVDNLTGRAVETLGTDSWWGPGVSINLDMTYQSPAPEGMVLDILVTVDRMTGSIAYTRCEVFEQATGERICSGNHVLMWRKPKKK
jgi:acyl-coenzyme A thioesterase PaaI-like protein